MCHISSNELIYVPIGKEILKKVNISTGDIIQLSNIPLVGMTKGIVIRCKDNRVYLGNSVDYKACVLNVDRLEYTEGYSFGPSSFVNNDIKVVPLINGSTLIYKQDVSVEEDDLNFSMFDYVTSSFKHQKIAIEENVPNSIFILNNGQVAFAYHLYDTSDIIHPVDKTILKIYR